MATSDDYGLLDTPGDTARARLCEWMRHVNKRVADLEQGLRAAQAIPRKRLGTAKAADYADCGPEQIRREYRAGRLRAVGVIGKHPRFTYEELDRWMAAGLRTDVESRD